MHTDTQADSERPERELTQSRRRRRGVVAAAGVASAVALGFVLWNPTSSPPSTGPAGQPSEAEAPTTPYFLDLSTDEQTPLPEELVPEATLEVGLAYSPDGTAVALDCSVATPCAGPDGLRVVSADGSVTRIPVPSEFNAQSLAWSRDSTRLLYRLTRSSTDLGDLFVYDFAKADSTKIADLGLDSVYWVDLRAEFSPNGQTVVFHRPRNATPASKLDVWTVPVTGGEPTLVFRNAAQPEFLPDGTRIAFVRPGSTALTGRVVAVAAPGEPPQALFETPEELVDYQLSPDATRALTSGENGMHLVDLATGELSDLTFSAQWAGNDILLVTPDQ
jgi:hypothetical protein